MPVSRRKHVPLRTCIACHQQRSKRDLIRVVRSPVGIVEIDPTGKRPGRGAYVCADLQCWEIVLGQQKLGRALKCEVSERDAKVLREIVVSMLAGESASEPE